MIDFIWNFKFWIHKILEDSSEMGEMTKIFASNYSVILLMGEISKQILITNFHLFAKKNNEKTPSI